MDRRSHTQSRFRATTPAAIPGVTGSRFLPTNMGVPTMFTPYMTKSTHCCQGMSALEVRDQVRDLLLAHLPHLILGVVIGQLEQGTNLLVGGRAIRVTHLPGEGLVVTTTSRWSRR